MFTAAHKDSINDKDRIKSALGHHLGEGGKRVKKDVRDTADKVRGDLDSMAQAVGEQVREFVENAGEGLIHAKESLVDASDTVATKISSRPLAATAIALGTGILLGALLRRAR